MGWDGMGWGGMGWDGAGTCPLDYKNKTGDSESEDPRRTTGSFWVHVVHTEVLLWTTIGGPEGPELALGSSLGRPSQGRRGRRVLNPKPPAPACTRKCAQPVVGTASAPSAAVCHMRHRKKRCCSR
jgi:hypothetical protein